MTTAHALLSPGPCPVCDAPHTTCVSADYRGPGIVTAAPPEWRRAGRVLSSSLSSSPSMTLTVAAAPRPAVVAPAVVPPPLAPTLSPRERREARAAQRKGRP